jgi:hypothetical protein
MCLVLLSILNGKNAFFGGCRVKDFQEKSPDAVARQAIPVKPAFPVREDFRIG